MKASLLVLACWSALAQTPPLPQTQPTPPAPPATGRPSAPMPVQQQSLEYFVGRWTFDWIGPETPLGPGPMTGTLTFTPRTDDPTFDAETDATSDAGPYKATSMLKFDAAKKALWWVERRPNGVNLVGTGDWSTPVAIRFEMQPFSLKGQTYRVKRTIAIVSAGSFSITEEYSVNGGPFKRLGNGVFSKAGGR